MLDIKQMHEAVDKFAAIALTGGSLADAMSVFCNAGNADSAVLTRTAGDQIDEVIAANSASEAEANEANIAPGMVLERFWQARVVSNGYAGFRINRDDHLQTEIDGDPFHFELLRPMGLFWQAKVTLLSLPDAKIGLILRRCPDLGPYCGEDVCRLDSVLPRLRAAMLLIKATLESETEGMAKFLARLGAAFVLNSAGSVVSCHTEDWDFAPISVLHGKLVSRNQKIQAKLDRAIASTLQTHRSFGLVELGRHGGRRRVIQVRRIPGRERNILSSAAAIAVLIDTDTRSVATESKRAAIRDAFDLTGRESEVAVLLLNGLPVNEIAGALGLQLATVRFHVKHVLAKSSTRRQAEFVALAHQCSV